MIKMKNTLEKIIYTYINSVNSNNKELYCFIPSNNGLVSYSYKQLLYNLILSKEDFLENSKNSYISMEIPIMIEFASKPNSKIENLSSVLEKLNSKNNDEIINTGSYKILLNDNIKNEISIISMFRNLFTDDRILKINSLPEATLGLVDQEKYTNDFKQNPHIPTVLDYQIYKKYPELFSFSTGVLLIHTKIHIDTFKKMFDIETIKLYLKNSKEEYVKFLENLFGTKEFNLKVYEYYEEYKKLNSIIEEFNKKGMEYQHNFYSYISKTHFIENLEKLNHKIMNNEFNAKPTELSKPKLKSKFQIEDVAVKEQLTQTIHDEIPYFIENSIKKATYKHIPISGFTKNHFKTINFINEEIRKS